MKRLKHKLVKPKLLTTFDFGSELQESPEHNVLAKGSI